MLPGINRRLPEGAYHLSDNEFINWLGMWMVMGCYEGTWGRRYWWSKEDIRIGRGSPFRLNEYMSCVRFEKILTWIKYKDEDPPHYMDTFFHFWKLVEAWTSNMSKKFIPGCISCLDESMMIWKNRFGPGWVFLPRKPHPCENE